MNEEHVSLSVPKPVIDFIMEHYGCFDVVEVNQVALYVLNVIAQMEEDGWKFGTYKTVKGDDGKEHKTAYGLDVNELIAQFRIGMADAMNKKKEYNPVVKPGEGGITNEGNNM